MDHFRQMAIFAKTMDHGSFRAAARALKLSPSVVSQHVSELEKRLGVTLIYRSTRSLSLTRHGEQLLNHARAMMEAAEVGFQSVSNLGSEPTGELKVTMPAVLAHAPIVEHLAAYVSLYQGINLSLDFSDSRKNVIDDGYDLAIRMGWLKDSALIARKLGIVERLLVACRSYAEARPMPRSPGDLSDWDWLELSAVGNLKISFEKPGLDPVLLKPVARMSANSAFAVYQFARAGAGLVAVPDFLARNDITAGVMQHILPDWTIDRLGIYAVWPEGAVKNTLTRHLVEHLAKSAKSGR